MERTNSHTTWSSCWAAFAVILHLFCPLHNQDLAAKNGNTANHSSPGLDGCQPVTLGRCSWDRLRPRITGPVWLGRQQLVCRVALDPAAKHCSEGQEERTRAGGAGEAAGGKLTRHLCFGPSPPCLCILNINYMEIKRGKNKHLEKTREENIHAVFFEERDEPTLKKCKCSRNQEAPGITHYRRRDSTSLCFAAINC